MDSMAKSRIFSGTTGQHDSHDSCINPLVSGIVAQQREGFPTDVQKMEHD
jgi:hypothetical protein